MRRYQCQSPAYILAEKKLNVCLHFDYKNADKVTGKTIATILDTIGTATNVWTSALAHKGSPFDKTVQVNLVGISHTNAVTFDGTEPNVPKHDQGTQSKPAPRASLLRAFARRPLRA